MWPENPASAANPYIRRFARIRSPRSTPSCESQTRLTQNSIPLPERNRSPARGGGDAGHETVEEFRHVDAERNLSVFVGVLKP